jgi:crotonobetaine/carnitine-CoA ligase
VSYAPVDRIIGHIVADKAARNGDKTFLLFEGRSYSYADMHRLSNQLANALSSLGVGRDTHVALLMENSPAIILAYFALGKLGAVSVPINAAAKGQMLAYFLDQSDADCVIFDASFGERVLPIADGGGLRFGVVVDGAPPPDWPATVPLHRFGDLLAAGDLAAPEVQVAGSDLMMIMYTSGTTGPSKGVMVSHISVLSQAMQIAEAGEYGSNDVLYTCMPLFHANAWWCSCLPAFVSDAALALSRRFSASQFWSEIRAVGATQFNLLGAMASFLWNREPEAGDRDHRVRQALVVPPPIEFYHGFEKRFGLKLKSLYGLTDACITAIKRPNDPDTKWKSAGRACDYAEIKIVDDEDFEVPPNTSGELVIRGRDAWVVAQGYYRMPEATVATWRNLWVHTGDRAMIDEEGYLYFVDRKKDTIRRRGENISSFEVEQIVLRHQAVAAVAAFAVRSEHGEDEVMVSVVTRPEATLSESSLIEHCDRNMPYFMVPRFVEFVDALPVNMSAKVEKYKLRAAAEARLAEIWDRERAGIIVRR